MATKTNQSNKARASYAPQSLFADPGFQGFGTPGTRSSMTSGTFSLGYFMDYEPQARVHDVLRDPWFLRNGEPVFAIFKNDIAPEPGKTFIITRELGMRITTVQNKILEADASISLAEVLNVKWHDRLFSTLEFNDGEAIPCIVRRDIAADRITLREARRNDSAHIAMVRLRK